MLAKRLTHVILLKNQPATNKQLIITATRTYFSANEIGKRDTKNVYDYRNKEYNIWGQMTDSTLNRLTDNSLIITVEGNFGSGKSEFARNLAKSIDFKYAREIDINEMYYEKKCKNYRNIVNEMVGDYERFRLNTIDEWHEDPTFKRTAQIQVLMYRCRWYQYRTALLHLFSTGQGVVLERSPFSDYYVTQALYETKLLSDNAWDYYKNDLYKQSICELYRPHVSIYIDTPVDKCLENIKKNGKTFEKESKAYSKELLQTMERLYKNDYMNKYKNDLFVLQYDSKEIVIDDIIDDLERLDLEDANKFETWRIRKEATINKYRRALASPLYCDLVFKAANKYVKVPELLRYGEEYVKLEEKMKEHPELKFEKGYNMSKHGLLNVLFGVGRKKDTDTDYL